jgi:hypothetical protein
MKKYLYCLDPFNRITKITETELDTYELENFYISFFDEKDVKNVKLGFTGVVDGKIIEIGLTEEENKNTEIFTKTSLIESIKENLTATDYQVIKCYEAQLLNEPMPYNLTELLAQRKAWRDEINAIEFELTMLG